MAGPCQYCLRPNASSGGSKDDLFCSDTCEALALLGGPRNHMNTIRGSDGDYYVHVCHKGHCGSSNNSSNKCAVHPQHTMVSDRHYSPILEVHLCGPNIRFSDNAKQEDGKGAKAYRPRQTGIAQAVLYLEHVTKEIHQANPQIRLRNLFPGIIGHYAMSVIRDYPALAADEARAMRVVSLVVLRMLDKIYPQRLAEEILYQAMRQYFPAYATPPTAAVDLLSYFNISYSTMESMQHNVQRYFPKSPTELRQVVLEGPLMQELLTKLSAMMPPSQGKPTLAAVHLLLQHLLLNPLMEHYDGIVPHEVIEQLFADALTRNNAAIRALSADDSTAAPKPTPLKRKNTTPEEDERLFNSLLPQSIPVATLVGDRFDDMPPSELRTVVRRLWQAQMNPSFVLRNQTTELEHLRRDILERTGTVEELNRQIVELQKQRAEINSDPTLQQLHKLRLEKQRLEAEIRELSQQAQRGREEAREYAQPWVHEVALANLQQRLDAQTKELQAMKARADGLEQALQASEKKAVAEAQQTVKWQQKAAATAEDSKRAEQKLKALEERMIREEAEWQAKLAALNKSERELGVTFAVAREDRKTLESQLQASIEERRRLEEALRASRVANNEFRRKLEAAAAERKQRVQQQENADLMIQQYSEEVNKLNASIQKLMQENEQRTAALSKQILELETKMKAYKEDYDTCSRAAKEAWHQYMSKLADVEIAKNAAENDRAFLAAKLLEADKRIEEGQSFKSAAEEQLAQLKAQLQAAQKRLEAAVKSGSDSDSLRKLQAQNDKLEKQLSLIAETVESQNEEIFSLRATRDKLLQQVEGLRAISGAGTDATKLAARMQMMLEREKMQEARMSRITQQQLECNKEAEKLRDQLDKEKKQRMSLEQVRAVLQQELKEITQRSAAV